MVLVGSAFLLLYALIKVFTVESLLAVLIVAIVYIVLGLVLGERPGRG